MSRTVEDVMLDLSYGALSNLFIGGSGDGTIPADKEKQIIHHLNRGLSKLHSRFVIYQRELFIRIIEGRSMYPLVPEASDSFVSDNPSDTFPKYILDTAGAPFTGDSIRILECWEVDPCDPDELIEVSVNDAEASTSVFTPASDVVQILHGKPGDIFRFMYQADHYKLVPEIPSQIVYLPEYLYEALEHYVAGKIFAGMNGEEHRARAADHLAAYQNAVQTAIDLDLIREVSVVTNTKLEMRGFK